MRFSAPGFQTGDTQIATSEQPSSDNARMNGTGPTRRRGQLAPPLSGAGSRALLGTQLGGAFFRLRLANERAPPDVTRLGKEPYKSPFMDVPAGSRWRVRWAIHGVLMVVQQGRDRR